MNHDGTSGTVDLFSKYVLIYSGDNNECGVAYMFNDESYEASNMYRNLISNYNSILKGFSQDVQNALMTRKDNGCFCNGAKITIPSIREVGCKYFAESFGTIYPLFGQQYKRPNELAIRTTANGNAAGYWTCDISDNGDGKRVVICRDGSTSCYAPYESEDYTHAGAYYCISVIAIIRFGK